MQMEICLFSSSFDEFMVMDFSSICKWIWLCLPWFYHQFLTWHTHVFSNHLLKKDINANKHLQNSWRILKLWKYLKYIWKKQNHVAIQIGILLEWNWGKFINYKRFFIANEKQKKIGSAQKKDRMKQRFI